MQTRYQSRRYHDEERGEEYNACDAYNEYCNGNDEYSDEGYGTYNSDDDYAHASINNYDVGNCGYTDEYDGCCYYTNDEYHCNNEYGGYYNEYYGYPNEYVGPETNGNETNFPLNDEDSGPTPREGGRGHSIGERCGIADHTSDMTTEIKENEKQTKLINMATVLKENLKEKE